MPHVSKIKLDKELETNLINSLYVVLGKTNKKETIDFLSALLTPTEKLMLAKRLAIVVLLNEEVPEYKIAQGLHVTRITVSRMNLFWEARGAGFDIAFKKLMEEKNWGQFKKSLLKIAGYSIRAASGYVKPTII